MAEIIPFQSIVDSQDESIYDVRTRVPNRPGALPFTDEFLRNAPSGEHFGWFMDAGMGWDPRALGAREFLILSTHGGMRAADGTPVALGYHSGHFEVHMLVEAAARELKRLGAIPFAGYCSDPCDGRTQGTTGMFDSLAYRNDAAAVFGRLIRSLTTRRGVIGVATCDKGLPAMMMALAATRTLPCIVVPGGATLLPEEGEDLGTVQSVGARYAHGQITLERAAEEGCRTCASPGGGCHFLGTAGTSQVVCEGLGLSLTHSALAPSGHPVWLDVARRSARAMLAMDARGIKVQDVVSQDSIHNALAVHAAFGGSTNLVLHVPAIAFAAGLRRPSVDDWAAVSRTVPRLVDVLPNGPRGFATVQVFLAGGVPEVMLHLRNAGLLKLDAMTVAGEPLGRMLEWWETSQRRERLRDALRRRDGIDPDDVIMDPSTARRRGLTPTVTFPKGNLAPGGSVIKSTAIDPSLVDGSGIYRKVGPARVFLTEPAAVAAIKGQGPDRIKAGDVLVLICRGPMGSGMEEILQVTGALKNLDFGKHVAVVTDARFSGVSTGACIGHVTPEALAGGPLGKVRDGDLIEIIIDRNRLEGSINLVGCGGRSFGAEEGARELASRAPRPDLAPDKDLPGDSRLWAALQDVSGGTWNGSVYDVDTILKVIEAGRKALGV